MSARLVAKGSELWASAVRKKKRSRDKGFHESKGGAIVFEKKKHVRQRKGRQSQN